VTSPAETILPTQRPTLLSCTCASTLDDEVVISLRGEVDLSSQELLRDLLAAAQPLAGLLVLDMAGVTFLDSSGIKEIVSAHRRGPLRIRAAAPPVRRVLELTGLASLLA
jgi:anti-sigma B factor antagonist